MGVGGSKHGVSHKFIYIEKLGADQRGGNKDWLADRRNVRLCSHCFRGILYWLENTANKGELGNVSVKLMRSLQAPLVNRIQIIRTSAWKLLFMSCYSTYMQIRMIGSRAWKYWMKPSAFCHVRDIDCKCNYLLFCDLKGTVAAKCSLLSRIVRHMKTALKYRRKTLDKNENNWMSMRDCMCFLWLYIIMFSVFTGIVWFLHCLILQHLFYTILSKC